MKEKNRKHIKIIEIFRRRIKLQNSDRTNKKTTKNKLKRV
jgi:hypothetical protein